jgi:putative flippase GtrA
MFEFFRYVIVGGIAFLVDAGMLVLGREVLFSGMRANTNLLLSTFLGFIFGLITNYLLSQWIVFRKPEQRALGWRRSAFIGFTVVGLIGLGLTAVGMFIGVRSVGDKGFRYVLVKIVVTAIVLIWNYAGKKIFVYKGR